ncbi:hypothetical protein [Spirosoma arcticum]
MKSLRQYTLLFPLVSIPVDFATGAIYKPKPGFAQKAPAAQSLTTENKAEK